MVFGKAIADAVGMEGFVALPYLNPDIGPYTRRHVTLEQRKEHALKPDDIKLSNILVRYRPGTIVVLGIVFHNTHQHLMEESPYGWKHFGRIDQEGLDAFESWLNEETKNHRDVSFVLAESEKHRFIVILDDTVASFANVDIFAESDILLTSLTKSFSGQSDVMGGSIVLNPLSPHYPEIHSAISSTHRNELFIADADVLLANSRDFLQRARRLNRNAHAMATFLNSAIADQNSPVVNVQYPALLPSKGLYDKFKRCSTKELPEPGYGCLMTVEFKNVATARAFYDRLGFYHSPHLGGHVTLALCYNMLLYSRNPEEIEYMRPRGVKEESVRISSGLEDLEDLIDTLKDALDAALDSQKPEE
ncbi:decarboxylase [Purpureocillium lavendulum]|uniref:Decarboxylase n=1 Tax=Purpureocillium lavendulum TaxID=1247861 RepID=A0AB34FFN0_9HYPO|nr:decarboxylase [Purpureocillium lavendulum]